MLSLWASNFPEMGEAPHPSFRTPAIVPAPCHKSMLIIINNLGINNLGDEGANSFRVADHPGATAWCLPKIMSPQPAQGDPDPSES